MNRGSVRVFVEVCRGIRRGKVALQPSVNGGKGGVGWRVEWGMRETR